MCEVIVGEHVDFGRLEYWKWWFPTENYHPSNNGRIHLIGNFFWRTNYIKIMEKVLEIPKITNTTLKYFVDGEFVNNVTVDEVNKIRENVLMHIVETKDASILDRFYFVGHEDSNNKMGEEIKITMDSFGNLSDLPWEMNHVRRSMMDLMEIGRENTELLNSFNNG